MAREQQADLRVQSEREASEKTFWDAQECNSEKLVEPDNVVELDGPSYHDTVNFINGRFNPRGSTIGYGEQSKKLVLRTQSSTAVFDPRDMSAEVKCREESFESFNEYSVIITAKDRKQAILCIRAFLDETHHYKLDQSKQVELMIFETQDSDEADKMMNAFAHLLGLLGATKEAF